MCRGSSASAYEVSFAQERFWFLDQLFPGGAEYNMPARYDLHGESVRREALREVFTELVRRHNALHSRFVRDVRHGPHCLCAWAARQRVLRVA